MVFSRLPRPVCAAVAVVCAFAAGVLAGCAPNPEAVAPAVSPRARTERLVAKVPEPMGMFQTRPWNAAGNDRYSMVTMGAWHPPGFAHRRCR